MLLTLLGVIIATVTTIHMFKTKVTINDVAWFSLIHALIFTLGLVICIVGIGVPLHGYYDPVIEQEYELAEVVEGTDVYVIVDSNRETFFKYITNSYETGIEDPYKESDVEIVISDKYDKPTLVKYYIKSKIGIFSFGLFGNSVDYKIYASEENIKILD